MKNVDLSTLKNHIGSRIQNLESVLGQSSIGSRDSSGQADDESAAMDVRINSAVAARISESEKLELARLKANLLWLDSDEAGLCESCGNDIPLARLMAVPTTRFCIQCAQKQ